MGTNEYLLKRYGLSLKKGSPPPALAPDPPETSAQAERDFLPGLAPAGEQKKISLTIGSGISIPMNRLPVANPARFMEPLLEKYKYRNPDWMAAKRFGRKLPDNEFVYAYAKTDTGDLILPRGDLRGVIDFFYRSRLPVALVDAAEEHPASEPITTNGALPGPAEKAFSLLSGKRSGILTNGARGEICKQIISRLISFRGQRTLIVVKRTWQLYLWQKIIAAETSLNACDIGLVGDKHCDLDKNVVVAIDRSLYQHMDNIKDRFGFLVVDLCDAANLKIFYQIVWPLSCRYLLGVAAGSRRSDNLTEFMKQFLGSYMVPCPTDDGRRSGGGKNPAGAELVVVRTNFEPAGDEYEPVLSGVCDSKERTARIVADILSCISVPSGRAVVVSARLRQLEEIQAGLMTNFRPAELISGKTSAKQLAQIVEDFNSGELRVILTTNKSLPGLDVKPVPTVFVAAPFKFKETAASVVRLLAPGGRIVEYLDDHMFCVNALKKRIGLYQKLNVICRPGVIK